ncbi:MAG TPA: hypothetical protein ENG27_02295 [Candidatus Bathyarchaeota archaeon]|nr:hypothetical protein [Candidatus Bathyarchaeota archaeon]
MTERKLGCPDETYKFLQRLRNHLISAKILHERFEEEVETYMKAGLHEEALKMQRLANSQLKVIRGIENEIEELERLCFGRRESP